MMNPRGKFIFAPSAMHLLCAGVCIAAIAGCGVLEVASEREARRRAEKVSAQFRPGGDRPPLPVLTAESPIEDYLRYAILNNPAVESAYYEWLSKVEDITVARSYPDPRLTLEFDIMAGIPSIMPGIMFDIPGPGKLTAMADMTAAESSMKYQTFIKAALLTAFDLEKACWELRYLDRKIEIVKSSLRLIREFEQAAQVRTSANLATLSDVLMAQIEQERLAVEIRNLEDSRAPMVEKFKAALGLKPEQEVPALPKNFPDVQADESLAGKLLEEAFEKNPELQAMKAEIKQAEASLSLAYKANIPDFTAGVEVDVRSVPVLVRPSGSMTLPVWRDKISAMIASAQTKYKSAEARLSSAHISLAVELAEKSYMAREASRNITVLREKLIPKSKQSVSIATTAYGAGSVNFQTLLETERMLLSLELDEAGEVLRNNTASADLTLLVVGRAPAAAAFDEKNKE